MSRPNPPRDIAILLAMMAAVLFLIVALPVKAKPFCPFGICASEKAKIYNADNVATGDVYNPGHGRKLQLRNNDRVILGYIDSRGRTFDADNRATGKIVNSKDTGRPWWK